jgi:hypothetical protein
MSGVGKRTIESALHFAQFLGCTLVGHLQKRVLVSGLEDVLKKPPGPEPAPLFLPYSRLQRAGATGGQAGRICYLLSTPDGDRERSNRWPRGAGEVEAPSTRISLSR